MVFNWVFYFSQSVSDSLLICLLIVFLLVLASGLLLEGNLDVFKCALMNFNLMTASSVVGFLAPEKKVKVFL